MTRYAKLTIAALATALIATLGTVGGGASAGPAIDKAPQFRDANWCC